MLVLVLVLLASAVLSAGNVSGPARSEQVRKRKVALESWEVRNAKCEMRKCAQTDSNSGLPWFNCRCCLAGCLAAIINLSLLDASAAVAVASLVHIFTPFLTARILLYHRYTRSLPHNCAPCYILCI